jgi:serine/threonine protein phosphatase PrpC
MTGFQWRPVGASVRGAAHVRRGLPNEDAFCLSPPGSVAGMAVADGHGDRRVFRASRGAHFAAEFGVYGLTRALEFRSGRTGAPELDLAAMVDELVSSWQDRVVQDCLARPPSEQELADAQVEGWAGDDLGGILGAYGTTLLAAAADERSLVVCQIGDGDLGVVHDDGTLHVPLAPPEAVGQYTTSMAMVGARDHVRIAIVDLAASGAALIWACTDGFSGAQAEADWRDQVARQLSTHNRTRGPDDVAARLPHWLSPAAETAGDDTTMTILLRAPAGEQPAPPGSEPPGEPTVPAAHPGPSSSGPQAGPRPGPGSLLEEVEAQTVPARRRRRSWRPG